MHRIRFLTMKNTVEFVESQSPHKRRRKWQRKPFVTIPETQSLERPPHRLQLSQHQSASESSDSRPSHLRRTCTSVSINEIEQIDYCQPPIEIVNEIVDENNQEKLINNNTSSVLQTANLDTDSSDTPPKKMSSEQLTSPSTSVTTTSTTTNSINIPNAQPEKCNHIHAHVSETTEGETEDTYVDYRITHVQGKGDNSQLPSSSAQPLVDGVYSLVSNSLKLSTV